jgi:hypothetical protein
MPPIHFEMCNFAVSFCTFKPAPSHPTPPPPLHGAFCSSDVETKQLSQFRETRKFHCTNKNSVFDKYMQKTKGIENGFEIKNRIACFSYKMTQNQ